MKILFCYFNITRQVSPQLGIAMLSAVAKKVGFETDIFDLTLVEIGQEKKQFQQKLQNYQPDILAVSCRSNEWELIQELFLTCKIDESVFRIFGGPHATTTPDETIELANIVVIGEGEETFEDILTKYEANQTIDSIPGTWYKKDNVIIKNETRNLIEDLDILPIPDWEIFDEIHYKNHYLKSPDKGFNIIGTFENSRGCPYACTYCTNSFVKNIYKRKGKWRRLKSPTRIIEEIKQFSKIYGLDFVYWIDEVLLSNKTGFLIEFQKLYSKEISVPFCFMERVENVTDKKIDIVKNAGAYSISIGIESGDEELRKNLLNRHQKQEQIIQAFKIAHNYGLKPHAFTMIGFPYETRQSINKTFQLIKKVKPYTIQTTIFHPLKATPLYDSVIKEGLFSKNMKMNTNYYYTSPLDFPLRWKFELKAWQKIISGYSTKNIRFWGSSSFILYLYLMFCIAFSYKKLIVNILSNKIKNIGLSGTIKYVFSKLSNSQ